MINYRSLFAFVDSVNNESLISLEPQMSLNKKHEVHHWDQLMDPRKSVMDIQKSYIDPQSKCVTMILVLTKQNSFIFYEIWKIVCIVYQLDLDIQNILWNLYILLDL